MGSKKSVSIIGKSVEKRAIRMHRFSGFEKSPVKTLILAATHGDEPKTTYVACQLIELLELAVSAGERPEHDVFIIEQVNPDGYHDYRRTNANRVDLNRNFPTADWEAGRKRSRYYGGPFAVSEPETRTLVETILKIKPDFIISLHSITKKRQCNNYNGRAGKLARLLARFNGYPAIADIGYSTPGSFGTWAGVEQDIPTVTLELPSHTSRQRDWLDNRLAILAAIGGRNLE